MAITHALKWADVDPYASGRPIRICYREAYAAMIASGAWRARKHKPMADEAHRAWNAVQKPRPNHLWIGRASKRDDRWFLYASINANKGKGGTYRYVRTVD